jgi:hypothetical protein
MRGSVCSGDHAQTLKAMDDREEARAVVGAAAEMAVLEIRTSAGMEPHVFDGSFATADGTEERRATVGRHRWL